MRQAWKQGRTVPAGDREVKDTVELKVETLQADHEVTFNVRDLIVAQPQTGQTGQGRHDAEVESFYPVSEQLQSVELRQGKPGEQVVRQPAHVTKFELQSPQRRYGQSEMQVLKAQLVVSVQK